MSSRNEGLHQISSHRKPGFSIPILLCRLLLPIFAITDINPLLCHAATYFVDRENGNDYRSGTSLSVRDDNPYEGPWRTLKRVNAANLVPGDTVLFHCGSVWRDDLVISHSGTSHTPITIGAYGENCTDDNRPTISGSKRVRGFHRYRKNIYYSPLRFTPTQVILGGQTIPRTRHPNRGYFRADINSRSRTQITCKDLREPPIKELAGASVFLRINSSQIIHRRILRFSKPSATITLDKPLPFRPNKGLEFYVEGKQWMLDAAREWHYDAKAGMLYLYLPETLGILLDGVEASRPSNVVSVPNRSNLILRDLAISDAGWNAVRLDNSTKIVVRNLVIDNANNSGIFVTGYGLKPRKEGARIDHCLIRNSGEEGIRAQSFTHLDIDDNLIADTGVGSGRSPRPSLGAIFSDADSTSIHNNIIRNSASAGIRFFSNSTVDKNFISDACIVTQDCGGIYTWNDFATQSPLNSTVTHNIVTGSLSRSDTSYREASAGGVGIYLDDYVAGVTVRQNVVAGERIGILLHNSYKNAVLKNTLYGNDFSQFLVSETAGILEGTVHDNMFSENILFPLQDKACITIQTEISNSTSQLASFSGNTYSPMFGANVVVERNYRHATVQLYSLSSWQAHHPEDGLLTPAIHHQITRPPSALLVNATLRPSMFAAPQPLQVYRGEAHSILFPACREVVWPISVKPMSARIVIVQNSPPSQRDVSSPVVIAIKQRTGKTTIYTKHAAH